MAFLEAIGVAALAMIAAAITFYTALRVMDHLNWWHEAGLAAFIPMFSVAIPLSLGVAGVVVWLLT